METSLFLSLFIIGCSSFFFVSVYRKREQPLLLDESSALDASLSEAASVHQSVQDRIVTIQAKRAQIDRHYRRLQALSRKDHLVFSREATREALLASSVALERSRRVLSSQEAHWLRLPHEFVRIEWARQLKAAASLFASDLRRFSDDGVADQIFSRTITFDRLINAAQKAQAAARPYLQAEWWAELRKVVALREQHVAFEVMQRLHSFQSTSFNPREVEEIESLIQEIIFFREQSLEDFEPLWEQLLSAAIQLEVYKHIKLAKVFIEDVHRLGVAQTAWAFNGEIDRVQSQLDEVDVRASMHDTWRELHAALISLAPCVEDEVAMIQSHIDDIDAENESVKEVQTLISAAA